MSRTTNPHSSKTFKTSVLRLFPPQHTDITKGHGRIETRMIWTSTELVEYPEFPYAAQVLRLNRHRIDLNGKKQESEVDVSYPGSKETAR